MARTSVLETAQRIRRQLVSSSRPQQLSLGAALDASETTVLFVETMPNGLVAGSTLGIDTELMRVMSVNTSTNSVVVMRGYLDTDPMTHALGTLVDVDPRFSLTDIVEAMRTELLSWGPAMYYPLSDTFTVSLSASVLELPLAWQDMIGVLELLQSDGSPLVGDTTWPRVGAKLIRGELGSFDGAPTSGLLLRFTEPIRNGQVYCTVGMPYDTQVFDTTKDLVTDLHLTEGMVELVELGAKKRVIMDGEYERVARQPLEPQRFGENTMLQSVTSMFQMFEAQYRNRKTQEINKLRRLYPLRIT